MLDSRERHGTLTKTYCVTLLEETFAISDKYDISALKSHGYFKYPAIAMEN
jgi:hypothetical protein